MLKMTPADIHDGPEHMLQSETECIDARPHQPAFDQSLLFISPRAARGLSQAAQWPRATSGYPARQSIVIVFVRTARAQLPNLRQALLQALKLQTNLRLHGVL